MNYSEKLKDPRWQKKRLQILQRDKWKCKYCGDEKSTLNVHHLKYEESEPWNEPKENLITVCEHCHKIIEYFKENFDVLKLKKFNCCYGKLFMIQCLDGRIYFDILCSNGEIIELSEFEESLIIKLGKYFKV